MQRCSPTAHVGAVHVPLEPTQSAVVAQALPWLSQPLRFALQSWGWAPLQRCSPTAQVGAVQVPVEATQSALVAHTAPALSQPLRLELQT